MGVQLCLLPLCKRLIHMLRAGRAALQTALLFLHTLVLVVSSTLAWNHHLKLSRSWAKIHIRTQAIYLDQFCIYTVCA